MGAVMVFSLTLCCRWTCDDDDDDDEAGWKTMAAAAAAAAASKSATNSPEFLLARLPDDKI